MKEYFIGFDKTSGIRHQPWTTAERDENNKYYDFRKHPKLIREGLEDYKPWDSFESIQKFYDLVEWLNSSESPFETNDCAFMGIVENRQLETFPKKFVAIGRLMIFFRNVQLNVSPDSRQAFFNERTINTQEADFDASSSIKWLFRRSREEISRLHPENEFTCIGIEWYPVLYEKASGEHVDKLGYELSYKFWAWGDNNDEVMENLVIVVDTLRKTFQSLIDEINAQ